MLQLSQVLEDIGCIEKTVIRKRIKATLFSKRGTVKKGKTCTFISLKLPWFLARLHFSAEELLLYPRQRCVGVSVHVIVSVRVGVGVRMQNDRANVKVMKF